MPRNFYFTVLIILLLYIVTFIVALSLRSGIFPQDSILAYYKTTKKCCRTISLQFVNSKLTQNYIPYRLLSHLSLHNLLPKFQSAYRKNHSSDTPLL